MVLILHVLVYAVLLTLGLWLYLLPSLIAFRRGRDNRWLVLGINVFFGSTFIGWGLALYLATRQPRPAVGF
ncbi:superinfection immunity protein [Streptomyces bambusae]|uniref:superinfection immunity protein n=1 Tax=Streptomyces bambusae TaxID=1550616 RepID=UPI001CFE3318|nr:superinfection immunity protein [Streptomyces bambusae]MCB5167754.1 superinfection immunity protein [Streptomyces bambusae]